MLLLVNYKYIYKINFIENLTLLKGQGFNICYLENQKNAERFDSTNTGSGKVIINTEMGAFGDDGCLDFIRTPYDRDIDAVSVNVGKQM